jgi:hypothetical protein
MNNTNLNTLNSELNNGETKMNLIELKKNCTFMEQWGNEEELTSARLELWDALFDTLEKFYGIEISPEFKTMGMVLNRKEFMKTMRKIDIEIMQNPVFAKETGIEEAFNYLYLQFI